MRARILLALALLAAAAVLAQEPKRAPAAAPPAPQQADLDASWRARLRDERAAIAAARADVREAQEALGDARQRHRPRGQLLAKLYQELSDAEEAVAAREAAWPDLLEEARQAGVSPAVLRELDEPVAAPGP